MHHSLKTSKLLNSLDLNIKIYKQLTSESSNLLKMLNNKDLKRK